MSIIDNIRRIASASKPETKSANVLPSKLWKAMIWAGGWENYSRWPKDKLITQAYERNAPFYAACNIIAQTVADIPVYVDASKNGRIVQTKDHPILKTMELTESRTEFIERLTLYLCATGEAYAQVSYSKFKGKRPLGLVVVPSQFMNPIMGDYIRPVKGFRYTENGQVDFTLDEIIYIRKPSLSEYWHGMSAGVPTAELIDLFNAGITWNKNIALAGGVPPIIATSPSMLPEEQNEAKSKWREQRGANNAHELTIVSGDLKIDKINDNPHDAEWEKATLNAMRMILMSFGVSSELLNDAGNKTYSNYREARKALYMEASIPMARKIYAAITKHLSKYYEDSPVICLDVDKIESIQEDRGFAAERLTRMVDAGIITPNEAREELGYSRKDGGDVLRRYLSTPRQAQLQAGDANEQP
jgi:HK97 family phage portal protein